MPTIAYSGRTRVAPTLVMPMMRPQPLACMNGAAARAPKSSERALMFIVQSQVRSSCATAGRSTPLAALATKMSTPPKTLTASCTRICKLSSRPTCALTTRARPPSAMMAAAVSSAGVRRRKKLITTDAPRRASSMAIARPMPRPLPVTIAVLPANSSPAVIGVNAPPGRARRRPDWPVVRPGDA